MYTFTAVTAPLVLTQVSCSCVTALLQPVYSPEIMQTGLETGFYRALTGFLQGRIFSKGKLTTEIHGEKRTKTNQK